MHGPTDRPSLAPSPSMVAPRAERRPVTSRHHSTDLVDP